MEYKNQNHITFKQKINIHIIVPNARKSDKSLKENFIYHQTLK